MLSKIKFKLMKDTKETMEELFDKAEKYSKTSIELYKLKLIDKSSSVITGLIIYVTALVLVLFFVSFINIALALYIGSQLGDNFLGFLIVSVFYLLLAIILFACKERISASFLEDLIVKLFLADRDENNK